MALPKPTYPSYRPKSFLEAGGGGALTKALEIYSKYHPGAMQQRIYQTILEDETFQAKQRSEQRELLSRERDQVLKTLSNFRETGLGPSGRGGGASGGARASGRSGGGNLAVYQKAAEADTRRLVDSKKLTTDQILATNLRFEPTGPHARLVDAILAHERLRPGYTIDAGQLLGIITSQADRYGPQLATQGNVTESQKAAAVEELWSRLTMPGRVPGLVERVEVNGVMVPQATAAGNAVAEIIDEQFKTNFLQRSLSSNIDPTTALYRMRSDEMAASSDPVGKSGAQVKLERLLDDAMADGTVDAKEAARIAEYRKIHGLAVPLDAEEQEFLNRYVGALRDDGVATREELGGDFDQAKAAYEKARNLERLPRGMAAFYDESYLRGLGRLSQIDKQMAGLQDFGSPMQTAARRALDLPVVSPEAIQAAGQVHPIAAEVLPYAMRRVMEAGGAGDQLGVDVEPKDAAESWAAQYVQTEAGARDFSALVDAVNKQFPQDSLARRRALAYYGAHHYQQDMKGNTLSPAALNADAAAIPTEAAAFMREVSADPAPALTSGVPGDPNLAAMAATELTVPDDRSLDVYDTIRMPTFSADQ